MAFLDDYESVADRIERFWKDHRDGQIITDLVHHDDKSFIVKATIWIVAVPPMTTTPVSRVGATGYAEEVIGATPVNKTSALENCETSAIGRALANLGYAAKGAPRPSREEMAKAQPEPRPRSGGRRTTPRTESNERPPEASTNGVPLEVAATVARLKTELLNRVGGDKNRAVSIWRDVLVSYGVPPDQAPPLEMLEGIETDLRGAA